MKEILICLGGIVAAGALAVPALGGGAQVTICHATESATNPYVLIHPAAAGVVHGHMRHHDDRDVVPPFEYRGRSYSQNWDAAGQALHRNGCVAPVPPGDGGGDSL